jgi:acetyl/propionyl-CoA carboxylase alpha subunit
MKIKKVLIANRGEIAVRIIQTLDEMQIQSIALYTTMEKDDLHVRAAGESVLLGNGTLAQTWLNIPLIVKIAKEYGADAIHPGYGFLSENALFAKACEDAGIIFIGPPASVIEKMGSKIMASATAREQQIPLLPRLEGTPSDLLKNGARLGFPLLVKAAAGGGGKGMIRIDDAEMLEQAVFSAAEQAKRYFDDDKVFLEKYVQNPRHIEVQILADKHQNVIHLHERECTLQRNHQKVVEEAPSASLNPENRSALHQAAVKLARAVGYQSAGTVEFILDEDGQFYFLEMNTRIQVEHPVTEIVTGIDIVKEQMLIAMGHHISFKQEQIHVNGHALEVRLYAEDPANKFRPSAGNIQKVIFPANAHVRVDSAINGSGKVHSSFDAMIAKIIVEGTNRKDAAEKMKNALSNVLVHGITSNIHLLSNIIADELFLQNKLSTHTLADNLEKWASVKHDEDAQVMVAALFVWLERFNSPGSNGAWRMAAHEKVKVNNHEMNLFYYPVGNRGLVILYNETEEIFNNISIKDNKIHFLWNNKPFSVVFSYHQRNAMFLVKGIHYHVVLPDITPLPKTLINGSVRKIADVKASLFGRVIKVNVSEKQKVKSGETLLVIESMKMENMVLAPDDNVISRINVKEGDQISDGQVLISFES